MSVRDYSTITATTTTAWYGATTGSSGTTYYTVDDWVVDDPRQAGWRIKESVGPQPAPPSQEPLKLDAPRRIKLR